MIPQSPIAWHKSCQNIKVSTFGGLSLRAYLKRPKCFNLIFNSFGEEEDIALKNLRSAFLKRMGKKPTLQKYVSLISENYPIIVVESWVYKNIFNNLPKSIKAKIKRFEPKRYRWVMPSQTSSIRLIKTIQSNESIENFPNITMKVLVIDQTSVTKEMIDQSVTALKNFVR